MGDIRSSKVYIGSKHYCSNIINTLQEPILVIDQNYRVVDANKPASIHLKRKRDSLSGLHCYEISHALDRCCSEIGESCPCKMVFETGKQAQVVHEHRRPDGGVIWEEILASPLKDEKGHIVFAVVELRDITELLKTREIVQELKSEIKLLRSFLPICANCKKIRNGEGDWEDIERYIQKHSEVDFSHTICLECQKKLYPEF